MLSWFPLFLPLREPLSVQPGQAIVAHLWRCCGAAPDAAGSSSGLRRVWYEWSCELLQEQGSSSAAVTPIQNSHGWALALNH
jgi:protein arginine N-methyltransferase 5